MSKNKTDGMCQSCLMPFNKDPKGESRAREEYCSYCCDTNGVIYKGDDWSVFKHEMYNAIITRGEPKWKAWFFTFMAGFAPRWKKGYVYPEGVR